MSRKRKSKKKNNSMLVYFFLAVFLVLMGFVLSSQSNHAEGNSFCEKLRNLDKSTGNYTELKDQLKKLCDGMELSKEEQELGNLSVEFIESLSIFNASWKENESVAKEYARKTDDSYLRIREINLNSSEIPAQIDSLYSAETGNLAAELKIQDMSIKNVTYSIRQLEENNSNLKARLESVRAEEQNKKEMIKNLSLIYSQRKNESNNLESSLNSIENERERVKKSFNYDVFPFLLIGIAIGGTIGFVLSLKWKKERNYWDTYSSSAKVSSPLKIAAILTGALIAILLLYLLLSGKLELILTG